MEASTQTGLRHALRGRGGRWVDPWDDRSTPDGRDEPVLRAEALRAAIGQLRCMTMATAGQPSRQALAASLVHLRRLGVDREILDLVVEMVIAEDVDEEMTAAINYLASGFLLALLAFRQEAKRQATG